MDRDEELKDWDDLADDEVVQLRKVDLDTIYTSIVQVSLALLAGDAELRSLVQGDNERADENWKRKVQALNDSRNALRGLLKRIAVRQGDRT